LPRATRAAAALKKELGLDAKLIEGSPGSFEVAVNGEVVTKRRLWCIPSEEEIVTAVRKARGQ
jgi:selenoprotein W-related protein